MAGIGSMIRWEVHGSIQMPYDRVIVIFIGIVP